MEPMDTTTGATALLIRACDLAAFRQFAEERLQAKREAQRLSAVVGDIPWEQRASPANQHLLSELWAAEDKAASREATARLIKRHLLQPTAP